tara:strand:+ start:376 stop:870 length:495 start_codon:yes stop_codon:yes gene_type:complete
MPFYTNAANNSTVYSSGEDNYKSILAADSSAVNNSTTVVAIPEFKIALGKYERIVGEIKGFFDTDASADLKVQFTGPASSVFKVAVTGVDPADAETSGVVVATNGDPAAIAVASAGSDDGFLQVNFVVETAGTAGDVDFKFAQNAAHASNTIFYEGTSLKYSRF